MIDKSRIKTIHDDINEALAAVAKKHNLKVGGSRIGYQRDNFKLTVEFGDRAELGDADPRAVKEFRKQAWKHRLDGKLGAKFKFALRGVPTELTVAGMRSSKVLVSTPDNKLYLLLPELVAGCLGV